jgi:hypothetical protein
MKTSFRDRHERLKYLKACETARRIAGDPRLIEQARRSVEKAISPDPHRSVYTSTWREMLLLPGQEIAAALIDAICRAIPVQYSVMGSPRGRLWHCWTGTVLRLPDIDAAHRLDALAPPAG